jgi:hypothetical protein
MKRNQSLLKSATTSLGLVVALTFAAGCEKSAESSRAMFAQRQESWSRELAEIKSEQATLAGRLDERLAGQAERGTVAERRMRALLDSTRQSIADVEAQIRQAKGRVDQAARHGSQAARSAIDDESARARGYLQSLGEQLGATEQQLGQFAANEDEAKHASP